MRRARPVFPVFGLPALIVLGALISFLALTACNSTSWPDRDPTVIPNVDADALAFWPPRRYALPGDDLIVEVRGLKTVYACAKVLELNPVISDSASGRYFGFESLVELPALPDCAKTPGLDTLLQTTAPVAGRALFLRTPAGSVTDSLRVIAGTQVLDSLLHVTGTADTLRVHNRFTLRDSTAGHPRRILHSDSLAACEVIQAAVFRRIRGSDTLSVKFRTLLASPLPAAEFPPCAGAHADTAEVVADRYGFP